MSSLIIQLETQKLKVLKKQNRAFLNKRKTTVATYGRIIHNLNSKIAQLKGKP